MAATIEETSAGKDDKPADTTVVTAASLTNTDGDLYICHVGTRPDDIAIDSVTGMGLTWTEDTSLNMCGGRGQLEAYVFTATGDGGSDGAVTATFATSPTTSTIVVHRITGQHATDPIQATEAANTNGDGGACTGGSDNPDWDVDETTLFDNSLLIGFAINKGSNRLPYTLDSPWTDIGHIQSVNGGSDIGSQYASRTTTTKGLFNYGGAWNNDTDWTAQWIEVREAEAAVAPVEIVFEVEPIKPSELFGPPSFIRPDVIIGAVIVKVEDESIGVTEGDIVVVGLVRQEDEAIDIAEGDIHTLVLVRQEDESIGIAEGDIKALGIVRQEDEAIGITEGDIHVVGLVRVEGESVGITETDLQLIGVVKVEDEAVGITEGDLHTLGLVRVENESIDIAEGDITVLSLVRVEDEAVGITEGDIKALAIVRQEDEAVGIAELVIKVVGLLRQEDESIGITEDDIHLIGVVKVEGESVGITEDDIRVRGLVRLVDETVGIAEGDLRFLTIVRIEGESIGITEQDLLVRDLVRVENELMGITEEAIRARGLVRVEAEGVGITEQDLQTLGLLRLVNETLGITEVDIKVIAGAAAAVVFSRITLRSRQDRTFKRKDPTDFKDEEDLDQ